MHIDYLAKSYELTQTSESMPFKEVVFKSTDSIKLILIPAIGHQIQFICQGYVFHGAHQWFVWKFH